MNLALDQYFTPPSLAARVASVVAPFSPKRVVDSNCGRGELLAACQMLHPSSSISGIDIDASVIDRLAKEQPAWQLHRGDALTAEAWLALGMRDYCAAILNPPFSCHGKKLLTIKCGDINLQASPALAHVISAIAHGKPKVIAAILPESCAGSDLDAGARKFIDRTYEVTIVERIASTAFLGASANSFIVRMVKTVKGPEAVPATNESEVDSPLEVVRGGIPVFQRVLHRNGLPFVHSVDLRDLEGALTKKLDRVRPIGRGIIEGHFVLFPRVGLPSKLALRAVHFKKPVQLSDCVMGVRCKDRVHAEIVARALQSRFDEFSGLYKGTGARYVTMATVNKWMAINLGALTVDARLSTRGGTE